MGNTDKFEMIANVYDTPERIQIAKVSQMPFVNMSLTQIVRTQLILGVEPALSG
jgi:hypothetical protein